MKYWLFFVLWIIPNLIWAEISWTEEYEEFSANVIIAKEEVSIPNDIIVELKLSYPSSYQVDIEKLKLHLLRHDPLKMPPFLLLSLYQDVKKDVDAQTLLNLRFQLQPQLPGKFALSFFNISFMPNDPQSPIVEIVSDIFPIRVEMSPWLVPSDVPVGLLLSLSPNFPITIVGDNFRRLFGPEAQQRVIKYNSEVLKKSLFPWWNLFFIGAVILLSWFLRESVKQAGVVETEEQRILRAREQALRSLSLLQLRQLPENRQFMIYYEELTETVRKFLEEVYQVHASTMTTQEFLQQTVKFSSIDEQTRMNIGKFLLSSDQVKFAHHEPSVEECSLAQRDAKVIIEHEQ